MKTAAVVLWAGAAAWAGLIVARGRFWDARADRLSEPLILGAVSDVHAVVPARNEADVLARTLGSLLRQQYPGHFRITVVDDRSDDGTGEIARATIAAHDAAARARVVDGEPRPAGWTGKVWALRCGIASARENGATPEFWWFSDADVEHDEDTLARLVATARARERDLVSQMVALHCVSPWERLLIPAFVYFFRMLYPFAWVNDDARRNAGAAGGCVLLADRSLRAIGGIERIAGELIDDCALAAAVKGEGGRLWLGLTTRSRSVRPYADLATIWNVVARTAYTQLAFSPFALAGTIAGMALLYVAPPLGLIAGLLTRRAELAVPGAVAWSIMSASYAPTLRLYGVKPHNAVALPLAAALYTAMTLDSALRHHRGKGGHWKGRIFTPQSY